MRKPDHHPLIDDLSRNAGFFPMDDTHDPIPSVFLRTTRRRSRAAIGERFPTCENNDVARPAESLIDPNEPRTSSKGQKTAYRSESRITKANADHLRRALSLNASPTNPPLDPPDICMELAHGACLEPAWDPHGIRIGSRGNRRADRTENARQSRGFDAKPRRQDKARETHCPRIMGLAWTCTNLS